MNRPGGDLLQKNIGLSRNIVDIEIKSCIIGHMIAASVSWKYIWEITDIANLRTQMN